MQTGTPATTLRAGALAALLAGAAMSATAVHAPVAAQTTKGEESIFFSWGGEEKVAGSGKQLVRIKAEAKPGEIIVSFTDRRLYFFIRPGEAYSYPIAIPRDQSRWEGRMSVTQKRENPPWTPTPEMVRENPRLPSWVPGGHPMNPLGVRALYLGSSTYRIHGTDAPWTIGSAVSKGCVRMYNQDVLDLYPQVKVGSNVTVTWATFSVTPIGNGAAPAVASIAPAPVAPTARGKAEPEVARITTGSPRATGMSTAPVERGELDTDPSSRTYGSYVPREGAKAAAVVPTPPAVRSETDAPPRTAKARDRERERETAAASPAPAAAGPLPPTPTTSRGLDDIDTDPTSPTYGSARPRAGAATAAVAAPRPEPKEPREAREPKEAKETKAAALTVAAFTPFGAGDDTPVRRTVKAPAGLGVGEAIISFSDRRIYVGTATGSAISYPISRPRDLSRWRSELRVTGKRENPTWSPTHGARRENPSLPAFVPAGHAANPYGRHMVSLGDGQPRIVTLREGAAASQDLGAAARMSADDISDLYQRIKPGARVAVTFKRIAAEAMADVTADDTPAPRARAAQAAPVGKGRPVSRRAVSRREPVAATEPAAPVTDGQ